MWVDDVLLPSSSFFRFGTHSEARVVPLQNRRDRYSHRLLTRRSERWRLVGLGRVFRHCRS